MGTDRTGRVSPEAELLALAIVVLHSNVSARRYEIICNVTGASLGPRVTCAG